MKKTVFLILMIFTVSCAKQEAVGIVCTEKPSEIKISADVPGLAMARLTDDLAESIEKNGGEIPPEFIDAGVDSLERLFPYAGEFEARTRAEGLHKWYRLHYDENLSFSKSGLRESLPGVELLEPVRSGKPAALPFNDPLLPKQWHYRNDGGYPRWKPGADINVFPVWENITTGSPEVVVAVVDGGIDSSHEDLAAHLDLSRSYNYCSGYRGPTIYPHDHGTHVAGTIAAINNNGLGVCGIAGGDAAKGQSGVTLISLQIFHTVKGRDVGGDGSTAIKEAADKGAVICQNSWGYDYDSEAQARSSSTPQYIKSAIDYFNKYAGFDASGRQVGPMAGGVVFFAAGNESWAYGHPGDYEGCIAVGSFSVSGDAASYTNYGDWVDIAAPGGDMYFGKKEGTNFYTAMVYSTVPDNGYASYPYQGTSMACPHASGVAALLVSYFGGKGFTREDLIHKLLDGADKNTLSTTKIGPKLDAWGSFTVDGGVMAPDTPEIKAAESDDNTVVVSLTATEDKNRDVVNQLGILISKEQSPVKASTPLNVADGVIKQTLAIPNAKLGETYQIVVPNLEYETTYYYKVFAKSKLNVFSDCSEVKSVYVRENLPPYLDPAMDDTGTDRPGTFKRISLDNYFHDPERKPLSYVAESSDESSMQVEVEGNILNLYPKKFGETKITVTASDKHSTVSGSFIAVCRDNSVDIDVFPNPFSSELNLRTASKCNATVRILNNTGAEVFRGRKEIKPAGNEPLFLGRLDCGVYTLIVETDEGKTYKKSIVKI